MKKALNVIVNQLYLLSTHAFDKKVDFSTFLNDFFQPDIAKSLVHNEQNHQELNLNLETKLSSIFTEVSLLDKTVSQKEWVLPNKWEHYERKIEWSSREQKEAIQLAISNLKKETLKIQNISHLSHLYQVLYGLVKQYTINLPIVFGEQNDSSISLFDYTKVLISTEDLMNQDIYLLEYDISGLQQFIFEITKGGESKKNIAKSLRGRSFYLSLLGDFIGNAILNTFELSYEYLLTSLGGKGQVLIPIGSNTDNLIIKLKEQLEETLYQKHQLKLSVVFSIKKIAAKALLEDFAQHMFELQQKLSTSKKQKYQSILKSNHKLNFPTSVEHRCELCDNINQNQGHTCPICHTMIQLSELLTKQSSFVVGFAFDDFIPKESKMMIDFLPLGKLFIFDRKDSIDIEKITYFITYNDQYLGEIKHYANLFADGKTFSEIAKSSKGDQKLALIKMDIDHLGLIFLKGLPKGPQAFLKYLNLSRSLDDYFTLILERELSQMDISSSIYLSYAGGDDLVMICPASYALQVTEKIYDSFNAYTGNPDLHLSTGIEIFAPKSPYRYAIDQAESYLEQSKSNQKNQFTFLSQTIHNKHIKNILKDTLWFVDALEQNQISRSLVYLLYEKILMCFDETNPIKKFYTEIPHISYQVERNVSNEAHKRKLKSIFVSRDMNQQEMTHYYMVLGYALLNTRKVEVN